MPAKYDFYQNPPSGNRKPRLHARIISPGTVNTDELANQIHDRCTVTPADVKAVLSALADVMISRFRDGERIHIDGLGYFQLTLSCPPVRTEKEIRAESIRLDSIAFRPEKAFKDRLSTITFERIRQKRHSRSYTEEEADNRLKNYFSRHPYIARQDFQVLMGYTQTTANRTLKKLVEAGKLKRAGLYHFPVYEPANGHYMSSE